MNFIIDHPISLQLDRWTMTLSWQRIETELIAVIVIDIDSCASTVYRLELHAKRAEKLHKFPNEIALCERLKLLHSRSRKKITTTRVKWSFNFLTHSRHDIEAYERLGSFMAVITASTAVITIQHTAKLCKHHRAQTSFSFFFFINETYSYFSVNFMTNELLSDCSSSSFSRDDPGHAIFFTFQQQR